MFFMLWEVTCIVISDFHNLLEPSRSFTLKIDAHVRDSDVRDGFIGAT